MDWNDLRYFLALVRHGTLAGAARALKVEHTTVSRRLSALESALGARLLLRTPDGFRATEAGQAILPLAEEMDRAAEAIARRAGGEDERLDGTVRVTTSESMSGFLVKGFAELRQRHPDLIVQVLSGNQSLDLMRGEADLALRIAPTTQPELLVKKIAELGWGLYAATSYFERMGTPASAEALDGHDVVGFEATMAMIPGALWLAKHGGGARVVLRGNSIVAALNATLVGMGIGALPCFMADPESTLRRIGGNIGTRPAELVVHPDLAKVARVRAVLTFIEELFRKNQRLFRGSE
jgi:DNA-binding transcriptional LysR family regulator